MKLLLLALAVSLAAQEISDAEVARVHKQAMLIDTHNDVTSRTVKGFDIGEISSTGHTDIARFRRGGYSAQFFAIYVAGSYVESNRSANRAMEMIDTVRHDIAGRYPDTFELANSADDVERIRAKGKIASLMGIEGGHAIEDSLRLLRNFYVLGVRYMTLTHANSNNWAGSSGDIEGRGKGLTPFGNEVVREMNRLGMMVDISHVSDKTFWDALAVSQAPMIASHSSARALCNVPRNMTDDMIVALAKKGGVVQVNFSCGFLRQQAANSSAFGKRAAREKATLADVVAHIDHIVKIAGINAVGIGGDFDGVSCTPEGLEDAGKMPNLTRALLLKGYKPGDIRKIYSANLLRVMRQVERTAISLRAGK
ncbi:MAG: membrane dipeptidase [Acidobacteria bacterium]|nr:membrane dipeptidase [Acidobacteriota bacterium]